MNQSPPRAVFTAYRRALHSQFSSKMLLMSIVPFLLSLALWGVLLYLGLQPFIDYLQALFENHGGFQVSTGLLASVGLGMFKTIVVPLIALLMLLPLMIMTSLIFMGVAAMPAIARHVGERQFPALERKNGGSFLGSMAVNASGFAIFVLLWLASLPLYLFAPLALLFQIGLWGWLTARVMSYDALSEHASAEERAILTRRHRMPLMAIGMLSGLCGAVPGVVWIGGSVLSIVLFPILAAISVWLYVIIFVFTGLWFQYFCLQALADLRAAEAAVAAVAVSATDDA